MAILGPAIAKDAAREAAGLTVSETGEVLDIAGDPVLVTQDVINQYSMLSAPVAQLVAFALLEAYPVIKAEYNQPIGKVDLVCTWRPKSEDKP
jgi:hypothetical protein